jgi:hypothetical protein
MEAQGGPMGLWGPMPLGPQAPWAHDLRPFGALGPLGPRTLRPFGSLGPLGPGPLGPLDPYGLWAQEL